MSIAPLKSSAGDPVDLRGLLSGSNEPNEHLRQRTMRLNKEKLAFAATLIICSGRTAYSKGAADQFQQLVAMSAQRLAIAKLVALAKWDSGAPVEDPSREAQVISSAVAAGESKGLDQMAVSNFFRAQIEANKLVQYSLLAEWRRIGKAPAHTPVDLAGRIRPELDHLGTALIAELAGTARIRAGASCRTDITKAVGKYVSAHREHFTRLESIALDRAMAGACT